MSSKPDTTVQKGHRLKLFLDQLHPSLALVSAGENNRYKHPNDETLKRFRNVTLRFYEQTRTALSVLRGGLSGQVKLSDNC